MSYEENGIISFKYQGLYYGFKFRNEVNFDKLGNKITAELKNMTLQDYEIMKGYRFARYITNLTLPPVEVWRLYRGRANAENQIAKTGSREYYVQIIDSKNNILGEKKTIPAGDKTLTYSFISTVKCFSRSSF